MISQIPMPMLEVGKYYVDRQWKLVHIVAKVSVGSVGGEETIFQAADTRVFNEFGQALFVPEDTNNIIIELSEEDMTKIKFFEPKTINNESSYAKVGKYTPHPIIKFEVEAILYLKNKWKINCD